MTTQDATYLLAATADRLEVLARRQPACAWPDEANDIHAGAEALNDWLPSFNADEMRAGPFALMVLASQCRALGSPDGTIPLSYEHQNALVDAARVLRRNVSRMAGSNDHRSRHT